MSYGPPFCASRAEQGGHTFVHWCSDASLASEYKEARAQARNIALHALRNANTYTLSFDPECGGTKDPVAVTCDELKRVRESKKAVGTLFIIQGRVGL